VTASLINGKEIAAAMKDELKKEIDVFKDRTGVMPKLVVVLVGDDPASLSYIRGKEKACAKVGIIEETLVLPADTPEEDLIELVEKYNQDDNVHGILVQLPLPSRIDTQKVIESISREKDVDGFHPENLGRLTAGEASFAPCTPLGIIEMLMRSGHPPSGKHVVILGRSNIVGKPLANLLMAKNEKANATVTVCHSKTPDLSVFTKQADILVVATGMPNTVNGEMVKEGVVVIDVGVNRVDAPDAKKGYKLVGDVDFEGVSKKAAAISPVPGGVGPMTITMLLHNTLIAAKRLVGTPN